MAKKKKYVFKILISGQGGVGKTTLLNRAVTGKFVANTSMTIGVEFHLLQFLIGDDPENQISVVLQGWDFGGQERFRFMLDSYVSGARGALLLYDLTRLRTLDNLEEWVQIVRKHDKDLPILFVGTKLDRVADITVADDYAKEFLTPLGLFGHMKISSKDGTGVSAAFKKICARILENNGVEIPPDRDLMDSPAEPTPQTPTVSTIPTPAPAAASQPPFVPPTQPIVSTPTPASQPPFVPPTKPIVSTPTPASQPPFVPPTQSTPPVRPFIPPTQTTPPVRPFIPPVQPATPTPAPTDEPESEDDKDEKKKKDKLFNYFSTQNSN